MNNSFWNQRNVFITGCTGLVGSWLTELLVKSGADVVGLVRDGVPKSWLITSGTIEKIKVVNGAIEDLKLIERTLNEYEVDTVFHLAAQTIVGTANRSPISTFETNIRGTWNILEACRSNSMVKRVVIASSDKSYGEQQKLPYDESTPLQGRHPYDVSKSCTDLLAQSYFYSYKLPVCITRCGNFYGGGDLNFSRLVPGTLRSVLSGNRPVIRSNGTYVRDYFYVKDGAKAYAHLAEKMENSGIWGEAFNFSNEVQVSVLELTEHILSIVGRLDLKPQILNEVANEIPHQYLSAEKARRELEWSPEYDLDRGLKETIEWYKTHFSKI